LRVAVPLKWPPADVPGFMARPELRRLPPAGHPEVIVPRHCATGVQAGAGIPAKNDVPPADRPAQTMDAVPSAPRIPVRTPAVTATEPWAAGAERAAGIRRVKLVIARNPGTGK
jgi:hypothetical protein